MSPAIPASSRSFPVRLSRLITSGWAAAALLALYWLMAVSATREMSPVFDEMAHQVPGYSFWLTGDMRLNPTSGNLPMRLAGLPLLFGHYKFPPYDSIGWHISEVWYVGPMFYYQMGNNLARMLLLGRSAIALLSVGTGLLVYLWSRRLFGRGAGMLSLTLFAFCPLMLSHGTLMTSDASATLFFLAAVGGIWWVIHRISPLSLLLSCAAMAGLFLSKFSAPLLVFMGVGLIAVKLTWGRPLVLSFGRTWTVTRRSWQAVCIALLILIHVLAVGGAIWAAFDFRYQTFAPGIVHQDDQMPAGGWTGGYVTPGLTTNVVLFARNHHFLPEAYLFGFSHMMTMSGQRSAFLNGAYSIHGWPGFFPYCLLVKTPPALFGLLALAAVAAVARCSGSRPPSWWRHLAQGFYRTAPLWALLAIYWTTAVTSHINIGQRHIMPTYPAMFILAGAATCWLAPLTWRNWRLWLIVVLLAWFVAESLLIRPHYLAYFNFFAGGPRHGYQHLVDSSLDWGQDLPGLRRWLDQHRLNGSTAPPVYLSYFGTGSPRYYGIKAVTLPSYMGELVPPPQPQPLLPLHSGVYCISATMVSGVYLHPPGPWTPQYEQLYRQLLARVLEMQDSSPESSPRSPLTTSPQTSPEPNNSAAAQRQELLDAFQQIRLARLCAYLRQREPDDQVGYSILIYRLTDQDVEQAVHGALP